MLNTEEERAAPRFDGEKDGEKGGGEIKPKIIKNRNYGSCFQIMALYPGTQIYNDVVLVHLVISIYKLYGVIYDINIYIYAYYIKQI